MARSLCRLEEHKECEAGRLRLEGSRHDARSTSKRCFKSSQAVINERDVAELSSVTRAVYASRLL